MAYQSGDNMFAYSKYIVAPNSTQYDTIQSAINDANADGGNVVVYIRPGTYTENLTLYSTVSLQGDSNELVTIVGVHTPPVAGSVAISFVNLSSATHIFSSAAAGAATITIKDCVLNCTNGYAFDLLNWTARLTVTNCTENSTDNHGVNNGGGASVLITDSNFGNSVTPMTLSGDVEIFASNIAAPLSVTGAGDVIIDNGSTLLEGITLAGTATLTIRNSSLETGASAAITTTSAGLTSLANITIDSAAVPVLDGTGSIQFGEVTYLSGHDIAVTIVRTYGTLVETGIISLPNTNSAETEGLIRFDDKRFISNYGTGNTFVGETSGNTTLTVLNATNNTAVGRNALSSLTTGELNVGVGYAALDSVADGGGNTAVGGFSPLTGITSGSYNTALGSNVAWNITTGSYNLLLGASCGSALTLADSSNILLMHTGVVGDVNTMRLGTQGAGNGQIDTTYIAGIYNTTPAGTGYPVVIDSNGQLGSSTSAKVISWTTAVANVNPVVANTGYVIKHATPANMVTLTLGATYAVGDTIIITGYTAGGWRLAQLANQQIFFDAVATTIGVGGYLEFTNAYDSITIVCVTANLEFSVISSIGNVTVV